VERVKTPPRKVGGKTVNFQDLQIPDVDLHNNLHRAMHLLYRKRLEKARACSVVALLYFSCDSAQLQQQARAAGVCQVPGWIDVWSIECVSAEIMTLESFYGIHDHYPLWGDRDKHPEAVFDAAGLLLSTPWCSFPAHSECIGSALVFEYLLQKVTTIENLF